MFQSFLQPRGFQQTSTTGWAAPATLPPTPALNHTGPVSHGPCKGQWGSKCFLPLGQWPLISQTGEAELLFHVLFPSGPMLVTKFCLFPLGCVAWGCIKKYNVEKSRR